MTITYQAAVQADTKQEHPPGDTQPEPAPKEELGTAAFTQSFALDGKRFATVAESIADLKNPDKDCSCTPDGFLAEITAFTQKFRRDIEWYSTPYYEVVFPALTSEQLDYLHQQLALIHSTAESLFQKVKGT